MIQAHLLKLPRFRSPYRQSSISTQQKSRNSMRLMNPVPAVVLGSISILLAGCASFTSPTSAVSGPSILTYPSGIKGSTYGGRQPIDNATITLYQTGTTGYGTGSSVLATTTTDANGAFNLSSFSCTTGTELYITSTGGDPYGNGENNVAATLMAGLVSCANIGTLTFVSMNEVTTVATVWSLTPFMTGTVIGAPTTNQTGLAEAFADVSSLVNIATGVSPGAGLPTGTTVPTAEIYTLADALASCVNSVDDGTTTSTGCSTLFANSTPSGGTTATDTVGAALNIARNPGNSVTAIITDAGPLQSQPYQPTISSANDLTMTILYSGSGISSPTAVAIDAGGDVWIANASATASVTELSHTGVAMSGTLGYTAGALNAPSAIAIDSSGHAWIANAGNSTLTELSSAGANVGFSPFSGGGLSTPTSISFDGLGNVWLGNSGNNSASEFSSAGVAMSTVTTGYAATGVSAPVGIALNPR